MPLPQKNTGSGIARFLNFTGLADDAEVMVPAVAAVSGGAASLTAAIAVDASASAAAHVRGRLIGGFYIPAGFEGGNIKFNRSLDGATWAPVKTSAGVLLKYVAASGDFVTVAAGDFVGVEYLQIVSCDGDGVAVNQAGAVAVITMAVAA
jgi:hypothetical protein